MNWEKIGRKFEEWRKMFLNRNPKPKIIDKRDRNITGNEIPPDVYGIRNAARESLKERQAIPNNYCIYGDEEYLRQIGHSQNSRGLVYKKPDRDNPINKEDIYNLRIALELIDDVNEFIECI